MKNIKITFYLLITIFLGIILCDLLTLYYPLFGKAGVIFWYLGFFILLIFGLKNIMGIIKTSWLKKSFFTASAFFIVLGLIIYYSKLPSSISGETSLETSCILFHLQKSSDWGFHQPCFLGYPSRQYLISAIPSLLFGRNLVSLNIGGTIYFIVGISIFLGGFFKKYKFTKKSDLIGAIIIASLFNFHYFSHFLLSQFEQSIFPLSLGFLGTGLLLHLEKEFKIETLLLIGIALFYIFSAYTPSIALAGIILFYLLLFLLKKNLLFNKKIFLLFIIIATSVSFYITTTFRNDIHIFGTSNSRNSIIFNDISNLLQHLFVKTNGKPFSSLIFSPIIILAIFSPLLLKEKKYYPISLWIIATIFVATISQGYSFYSLDFRIHRSIVVLPMSSTELSILLTAIF